MFEFVSKSPHHLVKFYPDIDIERFKQIDSAMYSPFNIKYIGESGMIFSKDAFASMYPKDIDEVTSKSRIVVLTIQLWFGQLRYATLATMSLE